MGGGSAFRVGRISEGGLDCLWENFTLFGFIYLVSLKKFGTWSSPVMELPIFSTYLDSQRRTLNLAQPNSRKKGALSIEWLLRNLVCDL